MMKMNTKSKSGRQRKIPLFWNLMTNPNIGEQIDEGKAAYYFLVVNKDEREIESISSKLYTFAGTCLEEHIDGKVNNFRYKLILLDTLNKSLNLYSLEKIYNGNLRQDKNLYERKSSVGLENYIISKLEKLVE